MKKLFIAGLLCIACVLSTNASGAERWWKGNLHTHSLWSDGNDYPEMIVDWYQQRGYNFLALSDHNRMLAGERWIDAKTNIGGGIALQRYQSRFGTNWVEMRGHDDHSEVRLRTLEEFRGRFEKPGKFLLVPGEEISDKGPGGPIHLNASNLRQLIPPQGGATATEVMQNDINAVLAQRKKTGQIMIPHINHPNFMWALTAEDILPIKGERFLEVYNGHPITKNGGDEYHASSERIWDILLTRRIAELKLDPIWGTAVDDSHNYLQFRPETSNPGRGWLMVRARNLSASDLIKAMEAGDFYASSGVVIKNIRRERKRLALELEVLPGVEYRTQFIGTRKGYDPSSQPMMKNGKELPVTRKYSDSVGAALAEVTGNSPAYRLRGDEIYVRAKVISSRVKENGTFSGEKEIAWVQPVIP
jgi:predicted metal-dependent phosphoesterase TrpH